MRKTAGKNPAWVVPRTPEGVRCGMVGVVENIKMETSLWVKLKLLLMLAWGVSQAVST